MRKIWSIRWNFKEFSADGQHLKALMYSGSINGANFASFMGFWGELREICIILLVNLKMEKQICTVKPYYILAKRFGLFAMRLPSFLGGEMDCWVVA